MAPDDFQNAWKAESSQTRVTVDPNALLRAVRDSQREFRMTILRQDVIEIGFALLMLPLWFFIGITMELPWSWYLIVPAIVWGIVFIAVNRARQRRQSLGSGEPLLNSVTDSLAQVENQIWRQGNIFWWYLLPYAIPIFAFFIHVSWIKSGGNWLEAIGASAPLCGFVVALYAFLYFLQQRVVRKKYEPRRQELLALLASLREEGTGSASGDCPILMAGKQATNSRPRMVVRLLLGLALLSIGVGGIVYLSYLDRGYPKRSPFESVTWVESVPQITVSDERYTLLSIDDIAAAEIVTFCQKNYGDKWQKRFEEDLVEVMTRMGHAPGDTVTLVVLPVGTETPKTIEDVRMTEENRRNLRRINQARERRDDQEATKNTVPIEQADEIISEMVPRLREEKGLVGLAAMLMVDGEIIASAVDGERKKGSGVPLTIDDRFHLGSITKSITSTMIARLVEAGRMQWDDTVGECFPEESVREAWKAVTLRQLLTHTAGAPANFSFLTPLHRPAAGPERTQARHDAVVKVIAKDPAYPPGEKHAYSNVGYTIAGAMAEQKTGETWEDLVQREVFEPLGLKGAGFGPPRSPDKTFDQPRGHSAVLGWKRAVGEDDDNTPIIGPAGTVHMTLSDLCMYATEHMRGELGAGTLLSSETYKLLHTPERDDYACGWVVYGPTGSIQHTVYWHNGSNTMWYAFVAFIPEKKMVVAIASNDGDRESAEAVAWEILSTSGHRIDVGVENAFAQDVSATGSKGIE